MPSFSQTLVTAADHELVDFVLHTTMVEGTPVFELRSQGDMTTAPTFWSAAGDVLTPASDPDA